MSHLRVLIAEAAAVLVFLGAVLVFALVENHSQRLSDSTPPLYVAPSAPSEATEANNNLLASVAAATSTKKTNVADASPSEPIASTQLALSLGTLRSALVNIICVSRDTSLRSISGTGVIISPGGLILTDAHIAQMFLLQDYPKKDTVTCVIRTGTPAKSEYAAKLAYISSTWLKENPNVLKETNPKGTGEHDVALLAITDNFSQSPLPSTLPYVPLTKEDPYTDEMVAIGAYPAQTLSTEQIRSSLYPVLVFSTIKKFYTFAKTSIDLLDFGGSAVAQEGSSGGGVVNDKGELIALITTSTIRGNLLDRSVHAITIEQIRSTFSTEMNTSLDTAISTQTPQGMIQNFASAATSLSGLLQANLK